MVESWQQVFLVVLVVLVFTAFVKEWLSVEVVALGALFACIVTGILPVAPGDPADMKFDALRVFAHPAPITVACMFVLSAALDRTGVIDALGAQFERLAATSPLRMLVLLMVVVALLSCFMNNTPVVVVFMPIVLAICRKKEWQASRFLIPLSYAAIVGGTMTIIGTSTNLIAAGIMEDRDNVEPFTMFEITPLGLVFVVVTLIYMVTLGRSLLPDRVTLAALIDSSQSREFITHAFVREGSALVGQTFADSKLANLRRARVLEVVRDGKRLTCPLPEIAFEEGDEILFKGRVEGLVGISRGGDLALRGEEDLGLEGGRTESALLMEGIIGPGSTMAGRSLKELQFRQRYGVIILAVHRSGRNLQERFEDEKLAFGDTLLVQGPAEKMRQLFQTKDFINLSEPKATEFRWRRAPLALSAIAAFMVLGALVGFGVMDIPVVVLAMGAALFVLVTRCIHPKEAYEAIEWKVLFLIFGMLGLGLAMERSGMAALLAEQVVGLIGNRPYLLIAGLYLLAALLTEVISNNAVAALLTPLALVVGAEAGFDDPRALVVAVMFGASASFSTPIGYQTNTFVYGAGGYKFGDFFRVGAPLAVILWIVASLLIPVFWPV